MKTNSITYDPRFVAPECREALNRVLEAQGDIERNLKTIYDLQTWYHIMKAEYDDAKDYNSRECRAVILRIMRYLVGVMNARKRSIDDRQWLFDHAKEAYLKQLQER